MSLHAWHASWQQGQTGEWCEGGAGPRIRRLVTFARHVVQTGTCSPAASGQEPDTCGRREGPPHIVVHSHASLWTRSMTVHCEGVFAAIISSEGRGLKIPEGGLRNCRCVVIPARQRRMTSPLGARRKERGTFPRPRRQHITGCRRSYILNTNLIFSIT